MTRYLLDTNVVSELRKPKPHGGVVSWIGGLRDEQLYISAVTIGELQRGIERARRQDTGKAREIERWAHEHDLPYRDGHVQFPDCQIEYRDADGR